jgi:Tfp pilus assembly protein PilF
VRYKWSNLLAFLPLLSLGLVASGCGASRDTLRSQNRLDLARDLLSKGELVGAESEANKALGYDPESEEAQNVLGLVYLLRAQQNDLLIEKADCLSPSDANVLRAEADQNMRTAEQHFRRATVLAPGYGEGWENRAVVAMYFHDWDAAVDMAKKALTNLERLQSVPLAHANLGWAYYQKQDYVLAVSELLQANQSPRYFCLGQYRLAAVYFARKEFGKSAEALAPIFKDPKLCPPLQEAQYLGGQTFLRLRDRDAALKAFRACVDMAPKSCQSRACDKALAEVSSD